MKRRPEQALHRACVEYLQILENQGKLIFFHPANGGYRTPREGAIFKGLGVKAGVSDLIIILPGGKVGCIELKAEKGRLTEKQSLWLNAALDLGALCAVARDLNEVENVVGDWLATVGLKGRGLAT